MRIAVALASGPISDRRITEGTEILETSLFYVILKYNWQGR
jgi:hypothetical protein